MEADEFVYQNEEVKLEEGIGHPAESIKEVGQ